MRQVYIDVVEPQSNDDRTARAIQAAARKRAALRQVETLQVLRGEAGYMVVTVLEQREDDSDG